jgi:hypothetical protein
MSYTDKIISLRAELKEALRDKVLFTQQQLEDRHDDDELLDRFYELPQTTDWSKHGLGTTVYIFELEGTMFKAVDAETGDVVEIDIDYVSLDALADFLDFEPIY